MTQNVSSKMLRSWMIQNRQSINYKTSKKDTIINTIIEADIQTNKQLLLSIGYNIYTNYYDTVLRSSTLTSNDKVRNMFSDVISSLTDSENKKLGIYEETTAEIQDAEDIENASLLENPYFTFYCSVYDNNIFKSFIIKNYKKHYKLVPGKKYIFNLEDTTNSGTSVSFSKLQYLYEDVGGIYRVGTPGTAGACIVFIPETLLSYNSVHIYNKNDSSSKSFTDFGHTYPKLDLEYLYKLPYPDNSIFYMEEEIAHKKELTEKSVLHIVQNKGPRFVISSDASYVDTVTDASFVSYMWYDKISDIKETFGMYYGHYTLSVKFKRNNRVCLLNKGQNSYGISMENLIQLHGNSSVHNVETYYLEGLDETGELDGYYDFYYTGSDSDQLTIKVLGDFEKCSLYTTTFGYNRLEDLFFFDGEYANYSMINPDGYQDISVGNIIGLQPESQIYFHDISSDILNLDHVYNDVSINDRPRMSLNYKDGENYNADIVYGLYKGQYIIKNIPEERPIAIINKNQTNSKEDCITYFGPPNFKKTRLGPDGKTLFDFFYQTLVIQVFGDFGKVTIYEYNDGFCGGENLLTYNESFSDISSEFQSWYETYEDASFDVGSVSGVDIDASNLDVSYSNIYQVSSYINCDVFPYSIGNTLFATIVFDDINNSATKYCFDTGNYVLMNVPSSNPIAFLNKDREDLFYYDGHYGYLTVSTASDGNVYNYYYGNINITVTGNFGQLSFETLSNSYLGGFRKLMYNNGDSNSKGEAVHHWGVNTYYDMLISGMLTSDMSDDPSFLPKNYYINVRTNTRNIYYSEAYKTYRLAGYDRNGVIDRETDNPDLTFAIGDIVYFTFDSNNEEPFGIYTYHNVLEDEQLITDNANESNQQIVWIPNLIVSNYYYYRSKNYVTNFMKSSITIINNPNAEIVLDISDIYTNPYFNINDNSGATPVFEGSTTFSILLNSFTIEFDETTNISSSKKMYVYNKTTNAIDITIPGSQLQQNTSKSATYQTGFTRYNMSSLEFDTSYSLLMDQELFENIYYNNIEGDIETFVDISAYNLLDFGTEPRHEPTFISISPASTDSLVDVSGYIAIEFNEEVTVPGDNDVPGNNNISFIDSSDNNSINYRSNESSGNYIYIYYSGLNYNTTYSVSFDEYCIVDLSNIEFTIAGSSLSSYSIQTIEDPRPQLQYFIPNNDISNIYVDQPISLIFNENVYLDTSSNGRIQIVDISNNGTVFDYFDVSNADHVSGIIFGSGTNTLRIYPFDADLSFASNTNYALSIDSNTIKDICDNYYPGIDSSGSNAITFTTGDAEGDAQESLTNETSGNIIVDDSGNSYIVFNAGTTFESKQYTLSEGSYTLDISESYPLALLNGDVSDIITVGISNDVIQIDVSGGVTQAYGTTNDYFVFTNSNGDTISLANGDLRFMRGQTYTFKNSTVDSSFVFVLYYGDSSMSLSATTPGDISFTLPGGMSTDNNSLYYRAQYTTSSNYDVSLTLLYADVSEDSENGNGSYDFYYGNVVIDVCSNEIGSLSFYTYNNGYMGGKYAFTFEDNYQS